MLLSNNTTNIHQHPHLQHRVIEEIGAEYEDDVDDEGGGYVYSITHRRIYAVAIALFAVVGVIVNSASLITLARKKTCSMFHNLLKVRTYVTPRKNEQNVQIFIPKNIIK